MPEKNFFDPLETLVEPSRKSLLFQFLGGQNVVTATKRVVFGPLTEGFENKRSRGGTPSESVFLPEVKGRNRPAELRPLRNYFLITESDEIEVIPWFSIIVFFEEFKAIGEREEKNFSARSPRGFFFPPGRKRVFSSLA